MSEVISFEPQEPMNADFLVSEDTLHATENGFAANIAAFAPQLSEDISNTLHSESTPGVEASRTSILDRIRSTKASKLAAGILATAAFLGTHEVANAQTIQNPNFNALEQFYDGYTKQFPAPVYVKPLADFYNPNTANWKCGGSQQILGQAEYRFNRKTRELTADIERKSAIYADEVVMTADPTPGPQTPGDQVWEKLALNCSSLVELRAKMQFFAVLPSRTKSGKKVTEWQRVPGTASIDLPEWQPSAVRNQATDDPAVNVPLLRKDTIKVKVSKSRKAKDLIGKKGVYPTIVLETKSTIKDYESKTAVILGKLSTRQIKVNAGSKYFGKGGALANVTIFDK